MGTPSLLRLANGTLLATHDYFGDGKVDMPWPQSSRHTVWSVLRTLVDLLLTCICNNLCVQWATGVNIYQSADGGNTWQFLSFAKQQYWSNIFENSGNLYLLGTSKAYHGGIGISRSTDGGTTWTQRVCVSGLASHAAGLRSASR